MNKFYDEICNWVYIREYWMNTPVHKENEYLNRDISFDEIEKIVGN